MSFKTSVDIAISEASKDQDYVGAVCRLNRDESLVFTVRNVEYGKQDVPVDVPKTSKFKSQPRYESILRLSPLKQQIATELKPLYVSAYQREMRYWDTLIQRTETRLKTQDYGDPELGALTEHRKALQYGFDDLQYWQKKGLETELEQLRAKKSRSLGQIGRDDTDQQQVYFVAEAERQYLALHGHATPYPGDYWKFVDSHGGAHAEENLIRAWPSMTDGIELSHVDLFITRMPCPDDSSGFRMGQTLYKEGCINKLIQLVAATGGGVTWDLRYVEELKGSGYVMTQTFAAGFPNTVTFGRFDT